MAVGIPSQPTPSGQQLVTNERADECEPIRGEYYLVTPCLTTTRPPTVTAHTSSSPALTPASSCPPTLTSMKGSDSS